MAETESADLLTARQVCELLNRDLGPSDPKCTPRVLSQWRLAGCPFAKNKRGSFLYPPADLADWLLVNAKVTSKQHVAETTDEEDPGPIFRTRAEVGDYFGVEPRTVSYWQEDKSFPCTPATHGKRNGYYAAKSIARWCILHGKRCVIPPDLFGDEPPIAAVPAPMAQAQHRLLDTRGSILELEYHRRRGELLEKETVKRFFERVNTGTRSIMNGLKPAILQRLPENLDRELVKSVVTAVDNCVADVCDAMNELIQGDQDELETKRV